ncbi:MAG: hypothetical protein AB1744_11615, partial [Candidatus Zixiibacteriota bacterium]
MTSTDKLATVIIFGTMHLEPDEFPAYAGRLREIIEEITPDIICAELSPEQLAGSQTCNSQPLRSRNHYMPLLRLG